MYKSIRYQYQSDAFGPMQIQPNYSSFYHFIEKYDLSAEKCVARQYLYATIYPSILKQSMFIHTIVALRIMLIVEITARDEGSNYYGMHLHIM